MAIEFVLPIVAGLVQGAAASGLQAWQSGTEANRMRELSRIRRAELQPLIDSLRQARDWTGAEENLVRNFSRAADQMAAESAQAGMTGAGRGGLDARRSDILGQLVAQLSEAQMADEREREMMLAQLLSDPSLYEGELANVNVGGQSLAAMLAGGLAGAGSVLPAFLSTEEGLDVLRGLGRQPSATGGEKPPAQSWWTEDLGGWQASGSGPTRRPASAWQNTMGVTP